MESIKKFQMKEKEKSCGMIGKGYCPRPLEEVASILSKKWTISVLITIGNLNNLRFNHIYSRVRGISPKTLSTRLSDLEKKNLITRKVYAEKPPRVEYSLTGQGKKLYESLVPLIKWASKQIKKKIHIKNYVI